MSTKTIEKLVVVVTAMLEVLLKILQKGQERSEAAAEIAQYCDANGIPDDVKNDLIEFV